MNVATTAYLEVLLVEPQRRACVLDRVVRLTLLRATSYDMNQHCQSMALTQPLYYHTTYLDAFAQKLRGEETQGDLALVLEAPELHRVDHLVD